MSNSAVRRSVQPSRHPIPARAARRAAENATPDGDCLISNYSVNSAGYAQVGWWTGDGSAMTTAHRAAWVYSNGAIPPGMTIDHVCKNRRCVKVDHLRMLTNFENARRTSGRDWQLGQCVNGHPNSVLRTEGVKKAYCPICKQEHDRRYKAKKEAANR